MELIHERKTTTLIFNPFIYIAGARALGLGLAALVLAGLFGAVGDTHFDGVLDTHVGAGAPLWFFLAEGVADWLCLSIVLWLFGKLVSPTAFRTIDLFGTQALARWPTILTALIALPPAFQRFSGQLLLQVTHPGTPLELGSPDAIVFFVILVLMLVLLCWTVALMYNAYSLACNIKGAKAIGTFIAGILLAEILSKIVLLSLLHWV
jgi:hypothetical protein